MLMCLLTVFATFFSPSAAKEPEKEEAWSDKENDVHHLTTKTFDEFLSENPSVLVMFYAPCKSTTLTSSICKESRVISLWIGPY